jgi:hypothetical protein
MNSLYTDPKRKGIDLSQREIPQVNYIKGELHIEGYQKYYIRNSGLIHPIDKRLIIKSKIISSIYRQLLPSCKSLNDLGCNSGYFSILALNTGFETVNAVDHDDEYLQIIHRIKSEFLLSLNIFHMKSSDYLVKADVTLALSLIHWIFSCTDIHGNVENIIKHLSQITNKVLILEWIDPKDEAIKQFNHIDFNQHLQTGKYDLNVFLECSRKYFKKTELLTKSDVKTRNLYILWK